MRISSHRENEVLLQLSGFRYLTEPMLEDFLFGGSSFTPLSRQVITRRVLRRLKHKGLLLETPRLVGAAGGTARLVYFLTAKGYNLALAEFGLAVTPAELAGHLAHGSRAHVRRGGPRLPARCPRQPQTRASRLGVRLAGR